MSIVYRSQAYQAQDFLSGTIAAVIILVVVVEIVRSVGNALFGQSKSA